MEDGHRGAAAVSLPLARRRRNARFPARNAHIQDLGESWQTPRRSANDMGGVVEAVVAPIS